VITHRNLKRAATVAQARQILGREHDLKITIADTGYMGSALGKLHRGDASQVFYAGDDATAKRTVRSLIESIGFEPMDAGPLVNARYLEPMGMMNIYFAYTAKVGARIAPVWLRG
jgi:hypothetical protein